MYRYTSTTNPSGTYDLSRTSDPSGLYIRTHDLLVQAITQTSLYLLLATVQLTGTTPCFAVVRLGVPSSLERPLRLEVGLELGTGLGLGLGLVSE